MSDTHTFFLYLTTHTRGNTFLFSARRPAAPRVGCPATVCSIFYSFFPLFSFSFSSFYLGWGVAWYARVYVDVLMGPETGTRNLNERLGMINKK